MNIKSMIPFLDEDELHQLAQKVAESPDGNYQGVTYGNLLPFLDEEDVDLLMISAYSKGQDVRRFYPFASDDGLSKLVDEILKNPNSSLPLKGLLPFLEDGDSRKIFDAVLSHGGSFGGLNASDLLPFMDDDQVDQLFLDQAKHHDPKAKNTAAFASEDAFHELVKEYAAHPEESFDFDAFYPFMDEDDVRAVFQASLGKK
jgi:hypothetical protein